MRHLKTMLTILCLCTGWSVIAQTTTVQQDNIIARKKLRVGLDTSRYFNSIVETIDGTATHHQVATNKAVWDLFLTGVNTVNTDATLSGDGTVGDPLKIAQQSATTGQVLKWNGTTWAPATDAGTTYTAGTGISIAGTVVSNTGDINAADDITSITSAGGDLSGIYPNPTVAKIQTRPVSATAPSSGEVLKWNGSAWAPATDATGSGTVTSVGLTMPSIFAVSGSPVTGSGTIGVSLFTQSANTVFAGPTTGAAATPGFRGLVAADIPNLDADKITSGILGTALGGTGLSSVGSALQYLRTNAGATGLEWATLPASGITGTVANNNIPKGNGTSALQTSLSYDNGTTVSVGTSSPASTGRLEVNKSYTNTSDVNIVAAGGIPMIGWRTTSANRFAMGAGYENNSILTLLGGGAAANPTTQLMSWYADGSKVVTNTQKLEMVSAYVVAGAGSGHSFGASAAPSGVSFYVAIPGSQRVRFQGTSGLNYMDFYGPASGSNRNYSFASGYYAPGDFNLFKSTSAGTDPSDLIWTVNSSGFMGLGESNPGAKLEIKSTGATSGTYGFRAKNSSSLYAFSIRDDRAVIFDNLSGTGNRLMQLDASGVATRSSVDPSAIPSGNIYTANGTLSGNRIITQGDNILTLDASSATAAISTPLIIKGKADGTNSTQAITFQNVAGNPLAYITHTNTSTSMAATSGRTMQVGAGTNAVTFHENGYIQLSGQSIDPTVTNQLGALWFNTSSARFKYNKATSGTTPRQVANVEDDIVGTSILTTNNITLTGTQYWVRVDANTGPITVTLDGNMLEGYTYLVQCRRNNINAVTFSAGSGYVLAVDGDSALTPSTYTGLNYEIVRITRFDTTIFIDK